MDDPTPSRRDRGVSVYANILGAPEEDTPRLFGELVGATFADEVFEAGGGAAWQHPALTPRDRSIAIITALVCQGVADKRLRAHIRLGRRAGLDEESLVVLALLLASYAGYPRASIAAEIFRDEFAIIDRDNAATSADATFHDR